jgi:hypothetical protein
MGMTNETERESGAVADDGAAALRTTLVTEGLEYALGRCLEEYALAMDGARHAANHAALGPADRRAYLGYVDSDKPHSMEHFRYQIAGHQ